MSRPTLSRNHGDKKAEALSTREAVVLGAREALLNGSGKLAYFEGRGLSKETVEAAYVGYENGVFSYPCLSRKGDLLGVHYKSEARDKRGRRRQGWKGYAHDLPRKGYGKKPNDPAKVIIFGMETLRDLKPGSPVILACGEEDALSLRQAGYTALSQPGAGLLEPVYAREFAGLKVTLFYDAGEEREARTDAAKLEEAGAEEVSVVEWAPDTPNGTDINSRLISDPDGFEEWCAGMIAAARPVSDASHDVRVERAVGDRDVYVGEAREGGEAPSTVGRLLSEVRPEPVSWLWRGRIPLGKITVIDGDPGLGKSAMTLDLAARVSAGHSLADGTSCEAGGVVILSAEDGLADTIRPRLEAAGAALERVLYLATVMEKDGTQRVFSFPKDIEILRRGIERVSAKLVVVDPLMAFLSGRVDAHRDQDVRRALAPLANLAEDTGVAVVVVRHLNKASGGNPLYRGGGSIGIVGAARSALLVAKYPNDEDRRVLAPLKNNLSSQARSLAFVLREAESGAVRVEYKGETSLTAETLLAPSPTLAKRSALDQAQDFLHNALESGPRHSKVMEKVAGEANISIATLRRAKEQIGIRSFKEGGSWFWALPEEDQDPHTSQASEDERLAHLGLLPIDKPNTQGEQGAHLSTLEELDAHNEHLEEWEELPIGKPDFRGGEGQGAHGDGGDGDLDAHHDHEPVVCIHGFARGKGCYLCDPEHPFQREGR